MIKFCEFLRQHAMRKVNFKKEKMKLLTNEQQVSYNNSKICHICREKLKINIWKIKNIVKIGEYKGAAYSICNLKFNVLNKFPIVVHNGSSCDYHFVI